LLCVECSPITRDLTLIAIARSTTRLRRIIPRNTQGCETIDTGVDQEESALVTRRSPSRSIPCSTAWIALATLFALPASAHAAAPLSNDTLLTHPHPRPIASEERDLLGMTVALEHGVLMIDRATIKGVRLWRFTIDDAYWWVSDRGIIWGKGTPGATRTASSADEALAIYVTMPPQEHARERM
jgi:hypothetical protein